MGARVSAITHAIHSDLRRARTRTRTRGDCGTQRFDTVYFQHVGMHEHLTDARIRRDKAKFAALPVEFGGGAL
jgi:hypothetical protein